MDFWKFQNSAYGSSEATLYIYGDIVTYDLGDWNWPDDVVPSKFKNELNALGNVGTIHVRINSGGGSVFGAYAIMNLLKSHKARIITYNDGLVSSAATFIAMAGDKIVSALASVWMVHLPSVIVRDSRLDVNDLEKLKSRLITVGGNMVDIYHARTGISKVALEKMMQDETWMTGAEAKEKGFVDEVTDMEVAASLSTDAKSATFNGLDVSLESVANKSALVALLSRANTRVGSSALVATVQSKPPTTTSIANQNYQEEKELLAYSAERAKTLDRNYRAKESNREVPAYKYNPQYTDEENALFAYLAKRAKTLR